MRTVYVAGAYSASFIGGLQENMRRGMALANEVRKAGFAPFAPWRDFLDGLMAEVAPEALQAEGMEWLRRSDAVLVVEEGWERSRGTLAEIAEAKKLGIPVFWTLRELERWSDGQCTG